MRKLHQEKLIINLDKCGFFKTELVYVGFVVSQGCLKMDPNKVDAIVNWPTPKSIGDVRSFHGLSSFYRNFIIGFSHVCAPILNTIKGGMKCQFKRTSATDKGFELLKQKVAELPYLRLPNSINSLLWSVMLSSWQ